MSNSSVAREALILASSKGLQVARPMPAGVSSLIREAWAELDEDGEEMVGALSHKSAFAFFSHARSTFKAHLQGTFGMLGAWGQPADVRRAGLFHTAFSGDLFQFYVYDAANATDRAQLRATVGTAAERLTWLFGTVHRGELLGLKDAIEHGIAPSRLSGGADDEVLAPHRLHGEMAITNKEIAQLIVITLADYLEQMVDVNGWRARPRVGSNAGAAHARG